jgi:heme-degrading monooxygenase HmoA
MINVGLYYRVKSGHKNEFEEMFKDVIEYLKANVEGFLDARLYKNVGSEQDYMVYSEWKDLDAFRKFISSDAFRSTTQKGASILEGRPHHKIFQEIS